MSRDERSPRDLEMQVFDAEVATDAILETPKLQPASISRLVTLSEQITEDLRKLEQRGLADSDEATTLKELQKRMFAVLRRISSA